MWKAIGTILGGITMFSGTGVLLWMAWESKTNWGRGACIAVIIALAICVVTKIVDMVSD